MALPGTNSTISLNQIHVEAGGSSGTTASINDSDIRGLISKASGALMSFSDWWGASANTFTTSFSQTSFSCRTDANPGDPRIAFRILTDGTIQWRKGRGDGADGDIDFAELSEFGNNVPPPDFSTIGSVSPWNNNDYEVRVRFVVTLVDTEFDGSHAYGWNSTSTELMDITSTGTYVTSSANRGQTRTIILQSEDDLRGTLYFEFSPDEGSTFTHTSQGLSIEMRDDV